MSAITATDNELNKPVNVLFQQTLLRNAMARSPYFVGSQQGTVTIRQGSSQAMWRRIENLDPSVTPLAELTGNDAYGKGRTSVTPTFNPYSATVAKYGQHFLVNEEVDLFNFSGTMDKLVEVLGISAGRSANRLQRNVGDGNFTAIYANSAASEGVVDAVISLQEISNAVVTLDTNVADTFAPMSTGQTNIGTTPVLPAYWCLCHPHVAYDIARIPGFKSVETYAGQVATMLGEFGTVGTAGVAVRCVSSQDADISLDGGNGTVPSGIRTNASAVDTYSTQIFGKDAVGSVGFGESWPDGIYRAGDSVAPISLLVSDRRAQPADPYAEVQSLAYKFWHAGVVLNPLWGRVIISGATSLA